MTDVQIKMAVPETVAYLPMQGPYAQVPMALGRMYQWIAEKGLSPAGMPRAVYYSTPGVGPESEARWEVQAPVQGSADEQACDASGCGVKRVDARQVASIMYKGPYDGIASTYVALQEWVDSNGYSIAGAPEELYYSDPNDTPPDEYLTEIRFPVIKN